MQWVKASERLPDKRGANNSFIIRGKDMPKDLFGHGIKGEFVAKAFVNFDELNPKFYFVLGHDSYLSNETIEWLDETPSSEVDKLVDALSALVTDIKTSPTSVEECLSNSLPEAEELLKSYIK